MTRLIISQEQMEREAKALADYKKRKLKQIKDMIDFIDHSWETEINKLLARLDQELKMQTNILFNIKDMEQLLKDMGLEKVPPSKPKKKRNNTPKKTHIDLRKKLVIALHTKINHPDIPDNINKDIDTEKRGPGRPRGSKNKPKAESSTRTRKRRGPGRPIIY